MMKRYLLYFNHTWRKCELDFRRSPQPVRDVFGVLFIIVGVTAICGNILALYYLVKPPKKEAKLKSDKILLSLVINDLIIGFFVCPMMGFEQFFEYYFFVCHAQAMVISTFYFVASINIAYIAFYRCRILMKECDAEQYLETVSVNSLIICWWVIPPLLCVTTYSIALRYYVPMLALVYLLTLGIVCVSYVIIIRAIYKVKKTLSTNHTCRKSQARFKVGQKVAGFIICYIVCFSPIAVMLVVNLFYLCLDLKRPPGLQIFFIVADFLACVNSCINPWVYTLKKHRLKQRMERKKRQRELMKKYAVVVY
ncbi:cephalotocin receptor 2-like [Clytia hemisphaerica]|uniref:cephalotocin receptor 2-like n=1 Tax=Clytia hemisphaerica TaxID=252671 RepID=UPI0034D78CF6|eukprot:TCONS_00010945-protein